MEQKRILFWGDAVIETGFARVLHSIAKYLPDTFDISWIGVNYFGDPHAYPYRIYPAPLGGDIYGLNRAHNLFDRENPDIIFILNDAWIQAKMLKVIKDYYKEKPLPKIVTYTPVDAYDHDPDWYKDFDIVNHAVAYTKFGYEEILKASPRLQDRLLVIPHGVDTTVFHKLLNSKREIKSAVYPNAEEFLDSFIVFNGNRNQPRKKIDVTIEGFSLFAKDKPDNVKLYLHMGLTDAAVDIEKLVKRFGISSRLIVSNKNKGVQTIPVDRLNLIYNATDVGINTSIGEGWSLVNMEHAMTGAPQVVAGHSALKELYSDCGLLLPPVAKIVLDGIITTGYLVNAETTASGLDLIYKNKNIFDELSKKGIEKFSQPKYQWQFIAHQWAELFMEK